MDWVDMYPKSEHHLLIYSLTQITYVQNTPVEAARASNQEEGTFHLKMTTTLTFQFQLQLPTQPCLRTRCTLTKQGQRFLTKISTTTTNTNTTENLIRKFVQFSPKSVLLSTLTHLLSSSPTTSNLSSLALPVSLSPFFFSPNYPHSPILITLQILAAALYKNHPSTMVHLQPNHRRRPHRPSPQTWSLLRSPNPNFPSHFKPQ